MGPAVWAAGRLIGGGVAADGLAHLLLGMWLAVSLLILLPLGGHGHARFGAANALTALRAAGVVVLAAFVLEPAALADGARWAAVAGAIGLLALDGIDGALARRTGLASPYGARFDVEVDAALTLVLALMAWRTGAAGPAILALVAPYYAFRLGGIARPWLTGSLPPSVLRKAVCVVQVSAPIALLALPLGGAVAGVVVWLVLVAILASFGRDLLRLAQRR